MIIRWLVRIYALLFFVFSASLGFAQSDKRVVVGAERMDVYLPMLKGKKVALLINQTSRVDTALLLDTLLDRKVKITKIFSPEHGFRGDAEAGEKVESGKDKKTGKRIVSLYGNNKKPQKKDLEDVDVLIYDIQDVGTRFYTYISTLQYAMEACAEYGVELLILDRPNPNGHYVDGPVLDTSLRSFVGMQPIPIVYGMTPGEYAKMLVGERWFRGADNLKYQVISCLNYDHATEYELPVEPSPNLRTQAAILVYPALCLFEGTVISVGRGTSNPFQLWGHPDFEGKFMYSFKPVPYWGQKVNPMYSFKDCYGEVVAINTEDAKKAMNNRIRLIWLIKAYKLYKKPDFFNNFFEKLAGTRELRKQIEKGMSEAEIWKSWEKDLTAFKTIRKKYLLYKDFY
jgi:uncharacterized protein YbbC (DUF1343 family)